MTTGATGQLGLALPVQGELSGTWGDTVNNGITQYVNIAISGTLSFAGDGAITLANTTGDASASNIGATTAQYMAIRVTGTLTTAKVITAPSYSKTYLVDNAATGSTVTFKAAGQTGVSIAVGEKALVFFNGTDYVKVTSSNITGVTSVSVASANGFTGTSSGGATPSLTLATSITGVLKGNGTAISAASAGTDYVAPGGALGTPSSGALTNCTADGTNKVGYRNIPPVGTKTSSYTLAVGDVGEYVQVGSGGSITIPNATFAEGDVISIFNNTTGNITITCTITTAYIAGADVDKSTMSLATRGVATVLFISGTVCVVSGNVS
jgi:hypothetical protein